MKRLCLLAMTLLTVSCVINNTKDYVEDPAYTIATRTYETYISNTFMSAELGMFFSGYQKIREDRDASMKLAESYFGGNIIELFYEYAFAYPWGKIFLTDTEGEYKIDYRYGYPRSRSSSLSYTDGNMRMIMYEEEDSVLEAEMSGKDGKIEISSFNLECADDDGSNLTINLLEPLRAKICSEGNRYYPDEGALEYIVSGKVDDEFVVRFVSDGFVINKGGEEIKYSIL